MADIIVSTVIGDFMGTQTSAAARAAIGAAGLVSPSFTNPDLGAATATTIGVGTDAPERAIDVVFSRQAQPRGITCTNQIDDIFSGSILLRHERGVTGALHAGDFLGSVCFSGNVGSGYIGGFPEHQLLGADVVVPTDQGERRGRVVCFGVVSMGAYWERSVVVHVPASGTQMTLRVSQYQTGRPYSMLFWNNEFTIRPIPKQIHKVEIETYLTPVQFMQTTDHPILNQWVQYIAYGVACEILRDRNDFEGVAALQEGFKRQEALVLERQGVEEIGQRNTSIFASTVQGQGWNNGFFQGWQ